MKKKLLFLINTLTGGGAEKVLCDLVNNLDKEKYDITVQTIVDIGIHKESLGSHIKYKTINKFKNGLLRKIFSYSINFIIPSKITYKLFIKGKYDYEIAFLEGVPTKLLSVSEAPVKYAWVHIDLFEFYNGHEKVFPTLQKNIDCYKKYNNIICVADSTKSGFIKKFGFFDNLIVKYNIVDDVSVKEKSAEAVTEIVIPQKLKLVTVGRLTYQKGYDRLLEVHKRLIAEGFSYELWIIGEGTDLEKLECYINKYNLSETVKLLGFQKNPYKFIKNADLFVCSSRAEGFSLVVAEALILSTPVISTNCAGPDELLGNGEYGLLAENSVEGLYDGLKELLSNNDRIIHYKKQAELRSKDFRLEKSIAEIEKLFF